MNRSHGNRPRSFSFAVIGVAILGLFIYFELRSPAPVSDHPGPREVPLLDESLTTPEASSARFLRSDPDTGLEVQVRDTLSGEAIRNAQVTLRGPPEGGRFEETGAGRYVFRGERPSDGKVVLRADARGYSSVYRLQHPVSEFPLSIGLVPLSTLVVSVIDETGSPHDTPLRLMNRSSSGLSFVWPSSEPTPRPTSRQTNQETEHGVAVFEGLIPGSGYTLATLRDGLFPPSAPLAVDIPPGKSDLEIQVQIGTGIVGRILDCEGQPGDGFTIEARERTGESSYRIINAGLSEQDGSFEFHGLPPGETVLRFKRVGESRAEAFSVTVPLKAGEVHDCGAIGPTAVDHEGARLIGKVVRATTGAPIGQATIRCKATSEGKEVVNMNFESDEKGSFEICGLPEGEVFVSAARKLDGKFLFVSERPILTRSEERHITLSVKPTPTRPGGYLEIELVLPDGSVGDMRSFDDVRCYLHDRSGNWEVDLAQGGVQDEEGNWLLEVGRPSPGFYKALVTADGFIGKIDRCEIEDGKASRYSVGLIHATRIGGRLLDATTGKGIQGRVARELGTSDSRRVSTHYEDTGEDGTFAVFLFAPGEKGLLRLWRRGFKARRLNVTGRDADVGNVLLEREDH